MLAFYVDLSFIYCFEPAIVKPEPCSNNSRLQSVSRFPIFPITEPPPVPAAHQPAIIREARRISFGQSEKNCSANFHNNRVCASPVQLTRVRTRLTRDLQLDSGTHAHQSTSATVLHHAIQVDVAASGDQSGSSVSAGLTQPERDADSRWHNRPESKTDLETRPLFRLWLDLWILDLQIAGKIKAKWRKKRIWSMDDYGREGKVQQEVGVGRGRTLGSDG